MLLYFILIPLFVVYKLFGYLIKDIHFDQIWLGGTPNQTKLARTFRNKVKVQDLEKVLEPLFHYWKSSRQTEESFGDFTNRMVGIRKSKLFTN